MEHMATCRSDTVINDAKEATNAQSMNEPSRSYLTVPPPSDGGFHAWAQVVSGHLVVALTWGYAASFGVFQNYYEATLPQSPSDILWIGGGKETMIIV